MSGQASFFYRLEAAEQQRDELAKALQRIADGQEMTGQFTHADTVLRYQEIARAALSRLEEQK